jgi:hypothetical protein
MTAHSWQIWLEPPNGSVWISSTAKIPEPNPVTYFVHNDKARKIAFQDGRPLPNQAPDSHRGALLSIICQLSAIKEPWVKKLAEQSLAAAL